MPKPGLIWRHVTIGTRYSWWPGDERGWRSRGHRRHSSGDYKNPPPPDEHEGLRRFHDRHRKPPVIIPRQLRGTVGQSLVDFFEDEHWRLLVLAVGGMHAHLLAELPVDRAQTNQIIGDAKSTASRAIRREMPGKVWAGGGSYEPIEDEHWHRNTYFYIRDDQGPWAWRWTFREGVLGFLGDR